MKTQPFVALFPFLSCDVLKQTNAFGALPVKTGWCKARVSRVENAPPTTVCTQNKDDFSPDASSSARKDQEQRESEKSEGRFAHRKHLKNLRTDLESLRENLAWAEVLGDVEKMHDTRKATKNGENRDPEVVYAKALKEIQKAEKMIKIEKKQVELDKWTKEATAARESLARFNLEGLWVGK